MKSELHHVRQGIVRRMTVAIVALGFIAVWLSSAAGQEMRTWSDKTGKFKIQAKLTESSGGKVVLEREDGSQMTIPLDKLSEADQKFVADMQSNDQNPFQAVKPAKKAAKKKVEREEDEEESPKKPARKKKAAVVDGPDEDQDEAGGEVRGEPKLVAPKWSGVKEILPSPANDKWTLSIEAPEQPAAANQQQDGPEQVHQCVTPVPPVVASYLATPKLE